MTWQLAVKTIKNPSGETCWLVSYPNTENQCDDIVCRNSDELSKEFEIARDCCLKLSEVK